jgi:hypothetical protein
MPFMLVVAAVAAVVLAPAPRAAADDDIGAINPVATHYIGRETGWWKTSINDTVAEGDIWGCDLGHMFAWGGKVAMVFGDTYGAPGYFFPGGDWRSNTMALSSDTTPADGLTFDNLITDAPGHAKELLPSAHGGTNADGQPENTVIPSSGIAVGSRMYLHYFSDISLPLDGSGAWPINYSGIAYSDDGGNTWVKDTGIRWPADSNFGEVAFVKQDGYVYLMGIPAGRNGHADLGRVPEDQVLDPTAYEYWTGATWSPSSADAAEVVPGPVGELSIQYNTYYQRYLMMYLDVTSDDIVIRSARSLTGPWSDEQTVLPGKVYFTQYMGGIAPLWNDSKDIWFTANLFTAYNPFWAHTEFDPRITVGSGPPGLAALLVAPVLGIRRMGRRSAIRWRSRLHFGCAAR